MNKYDLNHVTCKHPGMRKEEWERAYRLAWETYFTAEHMETIMKRAYADNIGISKVMFLTWWFYYNFASTISLPKNTSSSHQDNA